MFDFTFYVQDKFGDFDRQRTTMYAKDKDEAIRYFLHFAKISHGYEVTESNTFSKHTDFEKAFQT